MARGLKFHVHKMQSKTGKKIKQDDFYTVVAGNGEKTQSTEGSETPSEVYRRVEGFWYSLAKAQKHPAAAKMSKAEFCAAYPIPYTADSTPRRHKAAKA